MNKELWEKAVSFHGHECPGLAIGVRASEIAMDLGFGRSEDEQVVCVTENDACGVDGVQAIMSCTIGKGNLIYRGTGKQAFNFFERKSGKKVRIVLKPSTASMTRSERQAFILDAPAEEVFAICDPKFDMPEEAGIFKTVICEKCGEAAAENKIRIHQGKKLCLDCYVPYDRGW